jgi:hypothetical protein
MRRRVPQGVASFLAVAFALAALAGCGTAIPMDSRAHLAVSWQPSLAAAEVEARASGRPVLVVCAAGACAGEC